MRVWSHPFHAYCLVGSTNQRWHFWLGRPAGTSAVSHRRVTPLRPTHRILNTDLEVIHGTSFQPIRDNNFCFQALVACLLGYAPRRTQVYRNRVPHSAFLQWGTLHPRLDPIDLDRIGPLPHTGGRCRLRRDVWRGSFRLAMRAPTRRVSHGGGGTDLEDIVHPWCQESVHKRVADVITLQPAIGAPVGMQDDFDGQLLVASNLAPHDREEVQRKVIDPLAIQVRAHPMRR
mmetsp:Transcript_37541/g.94351  ORF Transcript_37541/g.94351 Transcript_37541/m.94351 type:complete len:231 (-) Transcript_37541:307-999(-)